jgi:hypothetical protein
MIAARRAFASPPKKSEAGTTGSNSIETKKAFADLTGSPKEADRPRRTGNILDGPQRIFCARAGAPKIERRRGTNGPVKDFTNGHFV